MQDGGFGKFAWMLLAGFGVIIIAISTAALSKLSTMNDRQAEQAGDIKVILTNQGYQGKNVDSLSNDLKELRAKVETIERRQLEARNAIR